MNCVAAATTTGSIFLLTLNRLVSVYKTFEVFKNCDIQTNSNYAVGVRAIWFVVVLVMGVVALRSRHTGRDLTTRRDFLVFES
jgi:hypothetical protein